MEQKRWHAGLILAILALTYGLIFMERTAPGLVTPDLLRQFHISPSTLSLMTLGQYLVYALLQIPVALGARRFRPEYLLALGAIADGGGTLIFSLSHSFAMVVFSRVVVGIGDAFIWLNIVAVLARWFSFGVFGRVLGITGMSGNLGALVATIPLAVWVEASGWRAPFFVMGLVLMGLAIVNWGIFTRLSPVHPDLRAAPEAVPWKPVFRRRRSLAAVCLAHFGLMGPFLGFVSLLAVPYLRQHYHLSEVAASTFLAFGLLGSLGGGPIGGWLTDTFGVRKPYAAISLLNVAVWAILAFGPVRLSVPFLAFLFAMLGFANGASVLTFAMVRERFSGDEVGLASGIANMSGFFGAVLVPLVMGWALAHGASRWQLAVPLPFAAAAAVGCLLLVFSGETANSSR